MIQRLVIERFKSIRHLEIACRRVNLFIGPPDTGKTNILEALYFISRIGWGLPLDNSLRLRQELGFDHLFYRQFFDAPLSISMSGDVASGEAEVIASVEGQDRQLRIECQPMGHAGVVRFGHAFHVPQLEWVRFYVYTSSEHWQYNSGYPHGADVVTPPHGYNLTYIARHNKRVYEFLKEIVGGLNWKLKFDQMAKQFRLSEVRGDEILDYNLDLLSDSLKRLFFYGAILLTSKRAVLVMDEPDVFAFPPYPKTLGEMIAADSEKNQFFLTTHNPYFLAGIVEKTRVEELALFVCSRDAEGGTAVKLLTAEEVSRVIEQGASVFFQLDTFVSP